MIGEAIRTRAQLALEIGLSFPRIGLWSHVLAVIQRRQIGNCIGDGDERAAYEPVRRAWVSDRQSKPVADEHDSPCNPETVIGEVLGIRAVQGADPAASQYICPFLKKRCVKRSTNLGDEPYPVCSLWRRKRNTTPELIFVCPKRFYAVDFLSEVIEHCWPGEKPTNPRFAPEVKMAGFGNVDFVIADVDSGGAVTKFLSVELQAIDITGSACPSDIRVRSRLPWAKTERAS